MSPDYSIKHKHRAKWKNRDLITFKYLCKLHKTQCAERQVTLGEKRGHKQDGSIHAFSRKELQINKKKLNRRNKHVQRLTACNPSDQKFIYL